MSKEKGSTGDRRRGAEPATNDGLDPQRLAELGLDPVRIRLHAERVRKALRQEVVTTLPCEGACTTNNGAVLSWKRAVRLTEGAWGAGSRSFADSAQKYWNARYLVTCIPAAGAASRYLASVRKFANDFESLLLAAHALDDASRRSLSPLDGLPALSAASRQALRNGIQQLQVSADMRNLADAIRADYLVVASLTTQVFIELSRHLTSETPLPPGVLGRRPESDHPEDSRHHFDDQAFTGSQDPSWDESIIRNHWEPYGGPSPALQRSWAAKPQSTRLDSWRRSGASGSALRIVSSATPQTAALDSLTGAAVPGGGLRDRESDVVQIYCACRCLLDVYESVPKAFVPTTAEGDDFLFLKLVEQMSLLPCHGNVMVCPSGRTSEFQRRILQLGKRLMPECRNLFELARTPFAPPWLAHWSSNRSWSSRPGAQGHAPASDQARGAWLVLEQGNALSTVRFNDDGTPTTLDSGRYSRVSAGHGELIHIFSDILATFPDAECLHIRNIDNVIGTGTERRREIQTPARLFRIVRDCLEALRFYFDALTSGTTGQDWPTIDGRARGAMTTLTRLAETSPEWDQTQLDAAAMCHVASEAVGSLFHWPAFDPAEPVMVKARRLSEWLARPLSVFGVVRKEAGDIGGGPVFARLADGEAIKLCMEMPHASDEDREVYFGSRGRATHFNPVLVFFELQTHKPIRGPMTAQEQIGRGRPVDFSKLFDDRFWLLARKEFQGQKVCYHETVLYELIGNSARTNLMFVEVPRTLFNPHKTFMDGLGQDRRSYGFGETLKAQDERPDSG